MPTARRNNASRATIHDHEIYAAGAFKNVYKGFYVEGERSGQECVCKIFKSGSVFEISYFASELLIVGKTLEVVDSFNQDRIINQEIYVNMPEVWTFSPESARAGEKNLIEPMIPNFEKFNSNTGWTPNEVTPWIEVMQALSHYSYEILEGKALLCDLQGGNLN